MSVYDKGNHPQLAMLKASWNYSDVILNAVLWAHDNESDNGNKRETIVELASQYIDFMDAYEYSRPEDAWEYHCINENIEHEIVNNPFID